MVNRASLVEPCQSWRDFRGGNGLVSWFCNYFYLFLLHFMSYFIQVILPCCLSQFKYLLFLDLLPFDALMAGPQVSSCEAFLHGHCVPPFEVSVIRRSNKSAWCVGKFRAAENAYYFNGLQHKEQFCYSDKKFSMSIANIII